MCLCNAGIVGLALAASRLLDAVQKLALTHKMIHGIIPSGVSPPVGFNPSKVSFSRETASSALFLRSGQEVVVWRYCSYMRTCSSGMVSPCK